MAHPVYKLFFFKRSQKGEALSPEAMREALLRVDEPGKRLGVRHLLTASTRWSNECCEYFGIELYPSMEALQEYTSALDAQNWFSNVVGESYLGIPMDGTANDLTPPEPPPAGEMSIYRVYLSRLSDYGHSLTPAQLSETWAMGREALFRNGGRMILSGYMRWNNEEWESFGVERFPNYEAVLSYSQFLSLSGWYRISLARSFLGVAFSGELA